MSAYFVNNTIMAVMIGMCAAKIRKVAGEADNNRLAKR